MYEKVSKWFSFKGMIERMALNYPIQGTSAEITKISCVYFFNWIKKHNLQAHGLEFKNKVLIVNTVHDENVVECPESMVQEVSDALEKAMNDAASIYCKRVTLTAKPEATHFWKK
jgi:DNA polymerase-1